MKHFKRNMLLMIMTVFMLGIFSISVMAASPSVQTKRVTKLTSTSVTLNGYVTDMGGNSSVIAGFVWGTNPRQQTTAQNIKSAGEIQKTGAYTFNLTGLTPNTKYYVVTKAAVVNPESYVYGNEISFTTAAELSVETKAVSNITLKSAKVSGNLTSGNGGSYGFIWGTTAGVTADNKTGGKTLGNSISKKKSFNYIIKGLNAGTTYYVRAVAFDSNNSSWKYGAEVSFTTLAPAKIEVTTKEVKNISLKSAKVYGNLVSGSCGSYGFIWSTTPGVTVDNKTGGKTLGNSISRPKPFILIMDGLSKGTTYYIRAAVFDLNNSCWVYGNEISFTTLTSAKLEVTTKEVKNISLKSAKVYGDFVSGDGGSYGFIWSTTPGVTVDNKTGGKTLGNNISRPKPFALIMNRLSEGTTYYIRAVVYDINNSCWVYGNEISFTTLKEK